MADFFFHTNSERRHRMITNSLKFGTDQGVPVEGELFKIIQVEGMTFEIRYGYYEECDRHSKDAQPVEIYPDFIEKPQYTGEGVPFATEMQSSCEHYKGKIYEDSVCGDCAFYQGCDELLGLCTCPKKLIASGGNR